MGLSKKMYIRVNKIKEYQLMGKCYFCLNNSVLKHHINYFPEMTIKLCKSCHQKLHGIIQKSNNKIIENDLILVKIFNLLKKCDKNSHENAKIKR